MALPTASATSTALVTGASSGIGADIARELAGRGHNVVLVARREERLKTLAAELADAYGIRADVLACDLADPEARDALPARVQALGLTVDILVNNAGYGSAGAFVELDAVKEAQMVRLNCEAVVALCGAFVPAMVQRGSGAVLIVASSAGFQPIPRQTTYGASKAFALSFSEALHTEMSDQGVAVTALCPGPVRTEFMEVADMEDAAGAAPDFVWVSAEQCARQAVDGLASNRRVVVPGKAIKVMTMAGQHTPRSMLLPIMKRFYPV